jgi:hypothetical protein
MQRRVITRFMKRALALTALVLAMAVGVVAQEKPAQTKEPQRGGFLQRIWPFGSSERLPKYKDARLRGLVLDLRLSEQPVRLSETRQLGVKVRLTNRSKRPVTLDFPNAQRIEIQLLGSNGEVLTKWSDNRAFAEVAGTVMINPSEHIEYSETISTRDLNPNRVFTVEAMFPAYPELRIREKFMTAP